MRILHKKNPEDNQIFGFSYLQYKPIRFFSPSLGGSDYLFFNYQLQSTQLLRPMILQQWGKYKFHIQIHKSHEYNRS